MVEPRGLIGVGMPSQLAKRLGIPARTTDSNLNGIGTTFAGAAAIGQFQFYVRANAQSTAIGYVMPNNAEVGSDYMIFNTGAVTAEIWPPSGGTFNVAAGATATGTSLAVGKGMFLIAVTASTFDAFLTA
jgi:hypothetical protein